MKHISLALLILAWCLLTPAIIISIPGWIVWVIAKTLQPQKEAVKEGLK